MNEIEYNYQEIQEMNLYFTGCLLFFLKMGFDSFFYSNENEEPIHIHVEKGNANGKIWLEPTIKIAYLHGFTASETKLIMQLIASKIVILKQKWNEHFSE